MRDLAALQSAMTQAILQGDPASLASELTAPPADALRRFNIYRNNTFLSLARHLKAVFPLTARLGGEKFFTYVAFEFIRSSPPHEPRLCAYGGGFPFFLARFPACRDSPILPAIASLERAIHAALTAPEEQALPATALADIGCSSLRLVLQPSLRFVLSRWPLLPLLRETHPESTPLARRTTYTAVQRAGDSIRFFDLSSARYIFWRCLSHGAELDHAAGRALARDPVFNLVDEILALFRVGLVIATDDPHPH
jgi:Putative DNA-binding domain